MSGSHDDLPDLSGNESESGFTESMRSQGAAEARVRRFSLRVLDGPDAGVVHTSEGDALTIGTHPSAGLRLADKTLSRFHCEIVLADGRALIRDLGSRNGTRVDSVLVQTAYLRRGAILTLGRTRMIFEIGADLVTIPLHPGNSFGLAVGRSVAMRAVFAQLARAAKSDITVLLRGETGVGKDLMAESLHQEGARRDQPFVVVDCGAMPAGLLESELFGHVKGAFTGADRDRVGAAESASGGTLFIDEIGELDLALQPKLLRLLERRQVTPVGTSTAVDVDVRVISATNRNLRGEVNAGRFRSDLYYRLAVMEIAVPPLRERRDDIPLLCERLIERAGTQGEAAARLRDPEFQSRLAAHDWPGNVRELRNYVERCIALADEPPPFDAVSAPAVPTVDISLPLKAARDRWQIAFERRYLEELLRLHGNNVSAAARAAEVDRVYFHRLLRRVGLR